MDEIFSYMEFVSSIDMVYTADIEPFPDIAPDVSNAMFDSSLVCTKTEWNLASVSNA